MKDEINQFNYKVQNNEVCISVKRLNIIDKKIYDLSKQGLNQSQIADEIGYTKQEVSRRIIRMKNMGITFNQKIPKLETHREKVCELVKNGLAIDEIANILRIEEKDVRRCIVYLRKHGLISDVTRKKRKITKKEYSMDNLDKKILELRKQWLTIEKISELLNKAPLTILRRIKKMKQNNIIVPGTSRGHDLYREKRNAEIAQLYKDGMYAKDIAKKFGISKGGVTLIANKLGVRKVKQNRIIDENERNQRDNEILDLYKKGMSMKKIGKEFNAGTSTVRRVLKKNNVYTKRLTAEMKNEILELRNQGFSFVKIGKIVGCNKVTASRFVRKVQAQNTKNNIEGVSKDKIINAIHNLVESRDATNEQLAVIAEYYGVELKDVLKVAKFIDER